MAIEQTMQLGGEAIPAPILELQQIALGMFLIWDALGDDYHHHELCEQSALADWANKYKVSRKDAIRALVMVKERFQDEPWCHYIHNRDFRGEGWMNTLIFNPQGNADVLARVGEILAARPFKEPDPSAEEPPASKL